VRGQLLIHDGIIHILYYCNICYIYVHAHACKNRTNCGYSTQSTKHVHTCRENIERSLTFDKSATLLKTSSMLGFSPVLCDIHGIWCVDDITNTNARLRLVAAPIQSAWCAVRRSIFEESETKSIELFKRFASSFSIQQFGHRSY